MRRAGMFALAAVVLLSAPSTPALKFTTGFDLGKIDGGNRFTLPVVLDNSDPRDPQTNFTVSGTFDATTVIPQAYTPAEENAIPGWVTPQDTKWTVPPHGSTNFSLTLAVPVSSYTSPTGVHSGPYQLNLNFQENQGIGSNGTVVGFTKNNAVGVVFIVRGVDVIGRIALPPVVKPETVLDTISLGIGNYLSKNVTGAPVQELYLNGELKRVFSKDTGTFVERTIPFWPAFPTSTFEYKPDLRGLPIGEYLVRTYAKYTVDGVEKTSRAKEQPLVIGNQLVAYVGEAVNSEVGRFDLKEGGQLQLPRGLHPTLQLNIVNVGDLLASVDLTLKAEKRGGSSQSSAASARVPSGATVPASLAFQLPSEGIYDLQLASADGPFWNATIEAKIPDVQIKDPKLSGARLSYGFVNRGVIVNLCQVVEIQTYFHQAVPNRNTTQECRILAAQESWDVRQSLNVTDLPDGAYFAHLTGTWTGSDGPANRDVAFQIPLRSAAVQLLFTAIGYWPILLGAFLFLFALIFVRRRRKKEGPKPPSKDRPSEADRIRALEAELRAKDAELKRKERQLEHQETPRPDASDQPGQPPSGGAQRPPESGPAEGSGKTGGREPPA